jgi:hypothetical protein
MKDSGFLQEISSVSSSVVGSSSITDDTAKEVDRSLVVSASSWVQANLSNIGISPTDIKEDQQYPLDGLQTINGTSIL